MKSLTPQSIRPPFAAYAHGVEIPAGWRIIRTSGQLGITAQDTIPEGAYAQACQCFENITAILEQGGMGPADVAHISAYVTERIHMHAYMRARDAYLAQVSHLPASTLMIVGGFTRPEFLVEVEVMAAAPHEMVPSRGDPAFVPRGPVDADQQQHLNPQPEGELGL